MKVWVVRITDGAVEVNFSDQMPELGVRLSGFLTGFSVHIWGEDRIFGGLPIGIPKQFELTAKEAKE